MTNLILFIPCFIADMLFHRFNHLPPMITSAILATEHDLDPPLANLMVALGLIISFVTLSMWWFMLRGV